MKGSELLAELSKLSEDELSLDVRIYADHGQQAMPADLIYVGSIDCDTYMADLVHPDDRTSDDVSVIVIE